MFAATSVRIRPDLELLRLALLFIVSEETSLPNLLLSRLRATLDEAKDLYSNPDSVKSTSTPDAIFLAFEARNDDHIRKAFEELASSTNWRPEHAAELLTAIEAQNAEQSRSQPVDGSAK